MIVKKEEKSKSVEEEITFLVLEKKLVWSLGKSKINNVIIMINVIMEIWKVTLIFCKKIYKYFLILV